MERGRPRSEHTVNPCYSAVHPKLRTTGLQQTAQSFLCGLHGIFLPKIFLISENWIYLEFLINRQIDHFRVNYIFTFLLCSVFLSIIIILVVVQCQESNLGPQRQLTCHTLPPLNNIQRLLTHLSLCSHKFICRYGLQVYVFLCACRG